ncbi:FKBP12-associated protein [Paraconiothyrium brasiliense]|uniref:FKBP12-associated protein n=1 Tax=Paraconiothyrium brasiliense TaxID=300254 RepID=A0ABR3QUE8_9PLEO
MPCKEEKACTHKILITCECQRIKQEAKCNASKNGEGNLKKTLKCDEECARLQRNQLLAAALHIDPDRQDDHVPYSADTLNMYQRNSTWAAAQEKILRLFAANSEEKRMRFKPMQSQQRAFIHSLAEDFGLDTESMDPEPHRHVALFKTPRFVMAPMKTLADCVRIRQRERATAATTARTATTYTPVAQAKKIQTADPYNGFLITSPRFALTIEEITAVLRSTMPKTSFALELEVAFLPSEEVSLKPPIAARVNVPEREIQSMLESIKPALSAALSSESIGKLQLIRTDASLNVQRRESDDAPGAGWSQVAKGMPKRQAPQNAPLGTKSGFAVLSLPRRKKAVEVADDWEVEEEKEEEKEAEQERGVSAESSGISSDVEGTTPETETQKGEVPLPERIPGSWADSE